MHGLKFVRVSSPWPLPFLYVLYMIYVLPCIFHAFLIMQKGDKYTPRRDKVYSLYCLCQNLQGELLLGFQRFFHCHQQEVLLKACFQGHETHLIGYMFSIIFFFGWKQSNSRERNLYRKIEDSSNSPFYGLSSFSCNLRFRKHF